MAKNEQKVGTDMRTVLINLMKEVKFPAFPGGSLDVSVAYQLPEHAFEAIADNLIANGVTIFPCKVGEWVHVNNCLGTVEEITYNSNGCTLYVGSGGGGFYVRANEITGTDGSR